MSLFKFFCRIIFFLWWMLKIGFCLKKMEVAQWAEVLAAKTDALSSLPGTMWWKERTDCCKLSCPLTSIHKSLYTHTHTHK